MILLITTADNRKNAGKRQFKNEDPRLQYCIPLDPRIHFALVCGAKSCPPIRIFTQKNCERALQRAAEGFCRNNVELDTDHNTITLSKIFEWYEQDFGANTREMLEYIAQFLEVDQQNKLYQIMQVPKLKVRYMEYDWSVNSQ
eukprot:TRINITY_DN2210_c0_g1_i2.p1 TRINITY_DN2210_c0_g1~~TRINITY_DN2210_c0_g1_i2.p1  ORF type:complete len:143 (-),score=13.68 TRINITY_DN2210_c0_g1_i2:98-526(-)